MRKTLKRRVAPAVIAGALALSLAACGGGDKPAGGEAGGDAPEPEASTFEGKGPITYVQGKDNSGKMVQLLDKWNEDHPDEQVTMIELSTEADQQRESMVNNAQTQSDAYCVMSLDNIWVPEFAAQGWVEQLPADEFPVDEFLKPVWETGLYRDGVYAVPHASDGGILYVRTDILKEAGIDELPESWEDMEEMWEKVRELPEYSDIGGYAGQFYKYEGFTVNADEAIHTNGGSILNAEGEPDANSEDSQAGLQRLRDGFVSGFIPAEALTYKEEEGRAAFEAGRIIFYRNWPYQYSLSEEALGADNFGITELPKVGEHVGVSSLGGHNAAVSKYCENKETALEFVKWFTSEESQQFALEEMSLAPGIAALYEKPENVEKFPYLTILEKSIENAVPRPRAVQYGDVSSAIQDSLWPVLDGDRTPEDALSMLDEALEPLIN